MLVVILNVEVKVGGSGVQLGVGAVKLLEPVPDRPEHELGLGDLIVKGGHKLESSIFKAVFLHVSFV